MSKLADAIEIVKDTIKEFRSFDVEIQHNSLNRVLEMLECFYEDEELLIKVYEKLIETGDMSDIQRNCITVRYFSIKNI